MRTNSAFLILILLLGLFLTQSALAESSAQIDFKLLNEFKTRPPHDLKVFDTPDDNGGSLTIEWKLSLDDYLWGKRGLVEKYIISRKAENGTKFEFLSQATGHSDIIFDNSVNDNTRYEYKISSYPFKYIFRPIPWEAILTIRHNRHYRLISPWLTLNPQGFAMSLISQNFKEFRNLNGFQGKLVKGSVWDNFSTAKRLDGPLGLTFGVLRGQLGSPVGGIMRWFAVNMTTSDPYQLVTMGEYLGDDLQSYSSVAGPVKATKQWFNVSRTNIFIAAIILCFFILFYIHQAKSGKELFIRKIAGLDAVEEAVGRATEMGREVFFVPGTQDMENIQTIAGVIILGRVARLTAELETRLEVPVSRSLVMVTAREIVKEAYMNAGRPDAFKEDMVHYLTDDQFGYAAAIEGKMVRQKPATIFYMGAFYAESLILAETGNSIGAIQIAGTAMPAQLPFFVAACDYTLIGEELFAASAYLSREPKLLGSLKGQDIGKAIILVALAVGVIVQTFGWFNFASLF